MIKNILVPVDLSPESSLGIEYAKQIALKFNAIVHFGHFLSPIIWCIPVNSNEGILGNMKPIQSALEQSDRDKLKKTLYNRITTELTPEIRGNEHMVTTSDIRSLDVFCEKLNFDLVVTGTSGTQSFFEKFVGNNTENMLR